MAARAAFCITGEREWRTGWPSSPTRHVVPLIIPIVLSVLTANPEPLAPFFDVVLLGDGEDLLPTFINNLQQVRQHARVDRLRALAKIPGIYVPSFFAPRYDENGTLLSVEPTEAGIPNAVSKQTWRGTSLSHSTVITPDAAWPDIHMVEVARSCPELCRFCMASYLTLPFRSPSLEDGLIPAVEKGLSITRRLGLLGASVTQHPQFSELLHWLNQDCFNDIRLSVSSVRTATVNPELTNILSRRGSKSLTIAIESGSERIRTMVNKKLIQEEIFAAAKYAREGGLSGLKLYSMVGLPTEEDIDVDATAELLLALKKTNPGLRLTLGVSTFVPKAHTPFQWQGVRAEAEKRLKRLGKQLKPNGIAFRPESFGWSVIQALLSRSDRRLAPVIESVRGSHDKLGGWKKAYRAAREKSLWATNENALPLPLPPEWEEVVHAVWEPSRVMPWTHLRGPLSQEKLIEHQNQALTQSLARPAKER